MADDPAPTNSADVTETTPETPRDAKPYIKMLTHAETTFSVWQTKCDNLAKDYADLKRLAAGRADRELQMFYANMEVIKPAIYSRAPQPVVVQRFKEAGKAVARKTSEMLERALVSSFDTEKVHDTLKLVRNDLALTARGVVWPRYESYAKPGSGLSECVRYDWVHRKDFLHEPARCWPEVGWVARRVWLTEKQGKARFKDAWTEIAYEDAADTAEDYKVEQKAPVWELWHKGQNLVVWIHMKASNVLDIRKVDGSEESPPQLEGFFPCPKPAYGVVEDGTLIPVPDAMFYKDQLEEINELTARMSSLAESLKLVIFYPGGAEGVSEAIETALATLNEGDNRRTFIPVASSAVFGAQGGIKDSLFAMPIRDVAETIVQLVNLRKQLMDDVREICGISDIMRGQTEASETLGAQQLKSQYGSIRIKDRQAEMVRVADEVLNIAGEIMAENFSPETLLAMSQMAFPKQEELKAQLEQQIIAKVQAAAAQAQQGAMPQPSPDGDQDEAQPAQQPGAPPPDPMAMVAKVKADAIQDATQTLQNTVTVEAVFALLRGQRVRPFILQIATDSTIQPDENAEKAARNEFATAFSAITAALAPIVQIDPAGSADFAGEMIKFVLAPFRAGRAMEQAVDEWVERMKAKAKEPPPPSPEMMKAQADQKALEADLQMKQADLADRQQERASKQQADQFAAAQRQQEQQVAARQQMIDAANQARDDQRAADQAAADAMIRDRETQARLAEIDRKALNDQAERAHQQRMRDMDWQMKLLDKELAELKIKAAREKPAPKPNGNGEAHA